VQTCTGNQSNGIAFTAPVTTLNIQTLTQPIAPPTGTTGASLSSSPDSLITPGSAGPSASSVTLKTDSSVSIITNATAGVSPPYVAAPGIDVRSTGAGGTNGTPGSSSGPGGDGGAGGAGGAVTVNTAGTVVSSFAGRPVNPRAVEFGNTTDLNNAQTDLKNAQDELGIRNFLSTATDDATKAACGGTLPCPANKLQDDTVRQAAPHARKRG